MQGLRLRLSEKLGTVNSLTHGTLLWISEESLVCRFFNFLNLFFFSDATARIWIGPPTEKGKSLWLKVVIWVVGNCVGGRKKAILREKSSTDGLFEFDTGSTSRLIKLLYLRQRV